MKAGGQISHARSTMSLRNSVGQSSPTMVAAIAPALTHRVPGVSSEHIDHAEEQQADGEPIGHQAEAVVGLKERALMAE